MEKSLSKDLKESLKRHMELLGYDPKKGKSSLTEVRRHKYTLGEDAYTDYADDETEDKAKGVDFGDTEGGKEGEGNADFDFGGDEGGEDTGGEFDFGGDEGGKEGEGNADFDFGGDEGGEETDEFGTADEFSAADDIESDEDSDVEEIDVTDIVKRADDAKGYAEKAVSAAEEGKNMIKDLMSKFETLQQSLGAIETVKDEVTSIKKDIQAQKPKEKLELRSLDSYPFNVKLTDYWNDEKIKDNYEITNGESNDTVEKVYKVTPEDAKDYNTTDIKKSFMPESRSKKKVLTESIFDSYLGVGNLGVDNHGGWIVYDLENHIEYDVVDDQCEIFDRDEFRYNDTEVNFTHEGDKVRVQYLNDGELAPGSTLEESRSKKKVLTEGAVIDKIKEIIKQIGGSGKTFKEIFSVLKTANVDSLEKAVNVVKTNLGLNVDRDQVGDIYNRLNEKLGLSLAESYSLQENGFLKYASKNPLFRLLTLAMAIMIGVEIARQTHTETEIINVEDKAIMRGDANSSDKYLIYTDKGVFEETDEMLRGKFNSSDVYNQLKIGGTYKVKTLGYRVPFLSMYKNIIEVEPVNK